MARPSHNGWPAVTPWGAWASSSARRWGVATTLLPAAPKPRPDWALAPVHEALARHKARTRAAARRWNRRWCMAAIGCGTGGAGGGPRGWGGGGLCVEPSRQQFGQAGHAHPEAAGLGMAATAHALGQRDAVEMAL